MAIQPELWQALLPVIDVLESLDVRYSVGGSVASSFAGVARATIDVDLVAELQVAHAESLTVALEQDYYVDLEMIQEAIQTYRSFNVIHLETMFKVDVFTVEPSAFAHENMRRRVRLEVPDIQRILYFTSPEDIVLHKLIWYDMGDGVSDRNGTIYRVFFDCKPPFLISPICIIGLVSSAYRSFCNALWMKLVCLKHNWPLCLCAPGFLRPR